MRRCVVFEKYKQCTMLDYLVHNDYLRIDDNPVFTLVPMLFRI